MSDGFNLAVVGATGAVGREMLEILHDRAFPIRSLKALASERSAGHELWVGDKPLIVETAHPDAFEGVDIALFSAGSSVSLQLGPEAWKRGCLVIDNSSAWRMDPQVPLVVPEVNAHALEGYTQKGIIGNPNCSTIQMVVALQAIHQLSPVTRVIVSTYQAASGAGNKGVEELRQQSIDALNLRPTGHKTFQHQLAFNVIPHIDIFMPDGFTREEKKMILETRKIMEMPGLPVNATCVRVPVFTGHSESIYVETEEELSLEAVREAFDNFDGLESIDNPEDNKYPMPFPSTGQDPVFVGRLRKDPTIRNGLSFWCVSDNLRKGAALNAVQIAEVMAEKYLNK
jgi:aspartate-semialdehyde dehydrogenase